MFIDDKGLLWCGGWIHNAPLSELVRFPYLLPQQNHSSALIVYHMHVSLSHAGVGSILTAIRQSFWIRSGRQYVKKLLRKCTTCKKTWWKGLLSLRIHTTLKDQSTVPPFSITGVDFTGALYIKQHNEESKVYICATLRAVHLEIVTDLSTTAFLLAFRRFVARRSLPVIMISDNATTYTSAAEELSKLMKLEEIATMLGQEGTVWKFILKKAPWFGGYCERLFEDVNQEDSRQSLCQSSDTANSHYRS